MKSNKIVKKTVWHKISYLLDCIDDFNVDHIRYCEFSTSQLIVNPKQKWAYLVHDPGTIVSEMSFEKVNYQKAIDKFGKHLKEPELEKL